MATNKKNLQIVKKQIEAIHIRFMDDLLEAKLFVSKNEISFVGEGFDVDPKELYSSAVHAKKSRLVSRLVFEIDLNMCADFLDD